jgi:hypothetical protein
MPEPGMLYIYATLPFNHAIMHCHDVLFNDSHQLLKIAIKTNAVKSHIDISKNAILSVFFSSS